jgi:Mg-chelatase subunit ChlD
MEGNKLTQAKQAISDLHKEMPPNDRIAVVAFDDGAFFKLRPHPVEMIRRKGEIPGLLDRIFAKGRTALYDAIWIGVEQLYDKSRKTLMLVLTDGEDNSSKHTHQEVLDLLGKYTNIELNIIHIDGSGVINDKYKELCRDRGTYTVIEETKIVTEVTMIFRTYYTK